MKKIYIFALLAFGFSAVSNAQLTDDFEAYNLGPMSPQSSHWRTWSGAEGGDEDGEVTDELANSGSKSLKIDGLLAPAGIDQVMYVPALPIFGTYSLLWNMYIPSGATGYFNMQGSNTPPGNPWNQYLIGGNVYFNQDGTNPGVGTIDGTPGQTFAFPHDQWFTIACVYDIDNLMWSMYIDGNLQFDNQEFTFNDPFIELAAIDFYAVDTMNLYYIDDVLQIDGEVTTLGTQDIEAKGFDAYKDRNNVLHLSANEAINNVSIYNMLGQEVYRSASNVSSVDMSSYANGTYIVKVNVNGTEGSIKVIR